MDRRQLRPGHAGHHRAGRGHRLRSRSPDRYRRGHGRGPGADNFLGARPADRSVVWRVLLRGAADLAVAQVAPRCWRWGEGLQRSAYRPLRRTSPDRLVRRPEGAPCGRPPQACGPRLLVVVMSRRTSFFGRPYPCCAPPGAAGGRSVQRPRCFGPGALPTVADTGSTGAIGPTETPRCSWSGFRLGHPLQLVGRRSLWHLRISPRWARPPPPGRGRRPGGAPPADRGRGDHRRRRLCRPRAAFPQRGRPRGQRTSAAPVP